MELFSKPPLYTFIQLIHFSNIGIYLYPTDIATQHRNVQPIKSYLLAREIHSFTQNLTYSMKRKIRERERERWLWAFPCGPKLSDTGCGFPALWFANSTDFLHAFNFSLQIRFLWLLFPLQIHCYDWSIKVYTLKLIAYVLGDFELFLIILGSGVQCDRPPRWFWNRAEDGMQVISFLHPGFMCLVC